MPEYDAIKAIMILLPTISELYGNRVKPSNSILKEACRLIIEKFPFIAVVEIQEAYRQWSVGEIIAKGAEMYGGELNVAQIGKILGAYNDRRKKVLGAYLLEKHEADERAEREEKARKQQEKFDAEFPEMIARAKGEITDWRDVPAFWYDAANKRGMFTWEKGEALAIFNDAKELEKIERQDEQENMNLGDILRKGKDTDYEERAKVIARKLAVFRKLI